MGDLGAESMILDIVFRLEKSVRHQRCLVKLFPAEAVLNNSEYVSGGKVTEKGLAELRAKMAHTDLSEFEADPDVNKIADLFTVQAIVNFIDSKVNG